MSQQVGITLGIPIMSAVISAAAGGRTGAAGFALLPGIQAAIWVNGLVCVSAGLIVAVALRLPIEPRRSDEPGRPHRSGRLHRKNAPSVGVVSSGWRESGPGMMKPLWIRRNGVLLHGLWRRGQGAPIVVIPGVMADAEAFAPAIAAMERPEPVLILDRRGRFPSGELGEGYSLATEVEDARAWVDHLGSPVIMVGWSYGATIALELAAGDDRVTKLVAYEPVLAPFGREALPALRAADLDRRVEIINRDISLFSRERVAALRESPTWSVLSRLAAPLPEELTALDGFQPDPLRWSKVAAEMILGEDNRGVEPYGSAFERVRALLPLATQTILPGQGHLAHADDPSALGRLIGELIGGSADARAQ